MDVLGQPSLFTKFKLPGWSFMYPLGYCVESIGALLGKKFKLTTFSVRMLLINRVRIPLSKRTRVRAHRGTRGGVAQDGDVVQGGVDAEDRPQPEFQSFRCDGKRPR